MHQFSEVNQLRTQCTILESQISVLQTKNGELQSRIDQLENSLTPGFKTIPNLGKFPDNPIGQVILNEDDGSFQL